MHYLKPPLREYFIIAATVIILGADFLSSAARPFLFAAVIIGALPTFIGAFKAAYRKKITIASFNSFALAASIISGEVRSSAFIVLMLAFAGILEEYTNSRSHRATEELLKLKPLKALREENGVEKEISADEVTVGDIIIVKSGARLPVDGTVIFGEASFNEASVTGESAPVHKSVGDAAVSGTLNESGAVKIKATAVGKNSTLEQMAKLIQNAEKNKSRSERMADSFAAMFLPLIGVLGIAVYFLTGSMKMVIALFLVACADDLAVAIPLAITAALGRAARRGVIIKGGEWLDAVSAINVLILDKTGTLTYGVRKVSGFRTAPGFAENDLWFFLGIAEKFSEQPIGRALFYEARRRVPLIPDPEEFKVFSGSGVKALFGGKKIAVGNRAFIESSDLRTGFSCDMGADSEGTMVFISVDGHLAGTITLSDVPREEAARSIAALKKIGISRILMFTGDAESVAEKISKKLGIEEFIAGMKPQDKLKELEALIAKGYKIGVVGDGINDAPALARSHVGIAMGSSGMAVTVEAADIIILTDDLSRIAETIELGQKTRSVIRADLWIWVITNIVGFGLVFSGAIGPALAAFYNFVTDFLPLISSARLFGASRKMV